MTMGPSLTKFWDSLSEERKERIEAEYQQEKAEYLTLQELRKNLNVTQINVAETLKIHQVSVSQIENGADPRISTVQDFIAALGGDLEIIAKFPGRPPVILKGFGSVDVFGQKPSPA